MWSLWARSHNSNKLDNYTMDFSWKQFRGVQGWGKIKNNYKLSYAFLSISFGPSISENWYAFIQRPSITHSFHHSFIYSASQSVIQAYDDALNARKRSKNSLNACCSSSPFTLTLAQSFPYFHFHSPLFPFPFIRTLCIHREMNISCKRRPGIIQKQRKKNYARRRALLQKQKVKKSGKGKRAHE